MAFWEENAIKFNAMLKKGGLYWIENFKLYQQERKQYAVWSDIELICDKSTTIQPIENIQDIKSLPKGTFIDVSTVVLNVAPIEEIKTKRKNIMKKTIQLFDKPGKMMHIFH